LYKTIVIFQILYLWDHKRAYSLQCLAFYFLLEALLFLLSWLLLNHFLFKLETKLSNRLTIILVKYSIILILLTQLNGNKESLFTTRHSTLRTVLCLFTLEEKVQKLVCPMELDLSFSLLINSVEWSSQWNTDSMVHLNPLDRMLIPTAQQI